MLRRTLLWMIAIGFMLATTTIAQVRSGSAFLTMPPGARTQAMAGAYAGVLDDPHAFFINPAATGFLHEWQWAASYSKWVADIYNASFLYGRKIRMPWSRQSRFAFGVLYQGMPEFDSSNRQAPVASAGDMVAALSFGQPLSFLTDYVSVGANAKYLNSTLAQFTAGAVMFDAGLTARTPRVSMGNALFPYGVLSVGGAISHYGQELVYESVGTPLPETWRVGGSLYLGNHKNLQLLLSADYVNVLDQDPYVALGGELMISRTLAINAGYDMGNELMEKLTLGLSLRLNDIGASIGRALPGLHNSFRMDFATVDGGDFMNRTFRGGVTHTTHAPGSFDLTKNAKGDSVFTPQVNLAWREAKDPDLFDEVEYLVVADRDSSRIAALQKTIIDSLQQVMQDSLYDIVSHTRDSHVYVDKLNGGQYHWTVIAADQDQQARAARKPGKFVVPLPDVEIKDIRHLHASQLNDSDYHGRVQVTVQNSGFQTAHNIEVSLNDEVTAVEGILPLYEESSNYETVKTIPQLEPGAQTVIEFPWHTRQLGTHTLTATAGFGGETSDLNVENNRDSVEVMTIPKGKLASKDTVLIRSESNTWMDLPFVTEITFEPNETRVKAEYLHATSFEPYLKVLAQRLINNPQMQIQLKGYVDSNSEVDDEHLANARALAVRDSLMSLGVESHQVKVERGEILPKRALPNDVQDAKWLLEERRRVEISADRQASAVLFRPVPQTSMRVQQSEVVFEPDIQSSVPLTSAEIRVVKDNLQVSTAANLSADRTQVISANWQPTAAELEQWKNSSATFQMLVKDSLGRYFMSDKEIVFLEKHISANEQRYGISLEFGSTDPTLHLYWEDLYQKAKAAFQDPNMMMKFEGHACSIGPAEVNERLSQRRARTFHVDFINYVAQNHPEDFEKFAMHIDQPVGYGESRPLAFELANGERQIVGNNETSVGRKLNRRVEIVFFEEQKLAEDLR